MTHALSLEDLLADVEAENFERAPLSFVPPTLRGYNMIWKLWENRLAKSISQPVRGAGYEPLIFDWRADEIKAHSMELGGDYTLT
ncbi:uncharacterized protein EAF01_003739 [Botrytis porri]|uniref:uncharacterized protein n=1 Tax=Botrytis porri TaxID=87229 RepID=UPI0019020ECF|nr:uncharacterized protein EAF01_003739 [Botrytis porri]KAF7910021.1 hypothetical protein EAF01_003739 [Botrytis porri]